MSEYVRFVSYVYAYHEDVRGVNVGYVKFESRSGVKRFYMQLSGIRNRERLGVYLFYRDYDTYIGIPIGTMYIRGQRGEFQYGTCQELFGENECTLQEVCGIVLLDKQGGENQTYYCTMWDDVPFRLQEFVIGRENLVALQVPQEPLQTSILTVADVEEVTPSDGAYVTVEEEKIDSTIEETVSPEPERIPPMPLQTQPEPVPENTPDVIPQTVPGSVPEVIPVEPEKEIPQRQPELVPEVTPQVVPKAPVAEEADVVRPVMPAGNVSRFGTLQRERSVSGKWSSLCKMYPKVRPFPYDTQTQCLKIRPGDLGRLPRENWCFAGNSFLLHGYYQHQYLLLLRRDDGGQIRYMLAVPGSYTENERFMAQMFGFDEFLPSPHDQLVENGFGYWLVDIAMAMGE